DEIHPLRRGDRLRSLLRHGGELQDVVARLDAGLQPDAAGSCQDAGASRHAERRRCGSEDTPAFAPHGDLRLDRPRRVVDLACVREPRAARETRWTALVASGTVVSPDSARGSGVSPISGPRSRLEIASCPVAAGGTSRNWPADPIAPDRTSRTANRS